MAYSINLKTIIRETEEHLKTNVKEVSNEVHKKTLLQKGCYN